MLHVRAVRLTMVPIKSSSAVAVFVSISSAFTEVILGGLVDRILSSKSSEDFTKDSARVALDICLLEPDTGISRQYRFD